MQMGNSKKYKNIDDSNSEKVPLLLDTTTATLPSNSLAISPANPRDIRTPSRTNDSGPFWKLRLFRCVSCIGITGLILAMFLSASVLIFIHGFNQTGNTSSNATKPQIHLHHIHIVSFEEEGIEFSVDMSVDPPKRIPKGLFDNIQVSIVNAEADLFASCYLNESHLVYSEDASTSLLGHTSLIADIPVDSAFHFKQVQLFASQFGSDIIGRWLSEVLSLNSTPTAEIKLDNPVHFKFSLDSKVKVDTKIFGSRVFEMPHIELLRTIDMLPYFNFSKLNITIDEVPLSVLRRDSINISFSLPNDDGNTPQVHFPPNLLKSIEFSIGLASASSSLAEDSEDDSSSNSVDILGVTIEQFQIEGYRGSFKVRLHAPQASHDTQDLTLMDKVKLMIIQVMSELKLSDRKLRFHDFEITIQPHDEVPENVEYLDLFADELDFTVSIPRRGT